MDLPAQKKATLELQIEDCIRRIKVLQEECAVSGPTEPVAFSRAIKMLLGREQGLREELHALPDGGGAVEGQWRKNHTL